MISKTQIKGRLRKKTSPYLKETVKLALKNKKWAELARILSQSTRNQSSINLEEIDKKTSPGDIVIVPGKILSQGDLRKKIRICGLGISSSAKEKLKDTRSEYDSIMNEMMKNPKAEGIKILK